MSDSSQKLTFEEMEENAIHLFNEIVAYETAEYFSTTGFMQQIIIELRKIHPFDYLWVKYLTRYQSTRARPDRFGSNGIVRAMKNGYTPVDKRKYAMLDRPDINKYSFKNYVIHDSHMLFERPAGVEQGIIDDMVEILRQAKLSYEERIKKLEETVFCSIADKKESISKKETGEDCKISGVNMPVDDGEGDVTYNTKLRWGLPSGDDYNEWIKNLRSGMKPEDLK